MELTNCLWAMAVLEATGPAEEIFLTTLIVSRQPWQPWGMLGIPQTHHLERDLEAGSVTFHSNSFSQS